MLQGYDLDSNGGLNGNELTPVATQAMQSVANDTGRAMAPMIGLVITPIGVAVCL
ncbi:DUF1007 family protein [Moraxella bovoculi]|uniref:DUF1007 family protein n=1 Tax=Moraxella bovoculi TaxID=386891 RepID=UPI0013C2BE2C|nr:DUF1007 family protein [Moraxella bovoculi]